MASLKRRPWNMYSRPHYEMWSYEMWWNEEHPHMFAAHSTREKAVAGPKAVKLIPFMPTNMCGLSRDIFRVPPDTYVVCVRNAFHYPRGPLQAYSLGTSPLQYALSISSSSDVQHRPGGGPSSSLRLVLHAHGMNCHLKGFFQLSVVISLLCPFLASAKLNKG